MRGSSPSRACPVGLSCAKQVVHCGVAGHSCRYICTTYTHADFYRAGPCRSCSIQKQGPVDLLLVQFYLTSATLLTLQAMVRLANEEQPTSHWRLHRSCHCCPLNSEQAAPAPSAGFNVWHHQGTHFRHCCSMRSALVALTACL